MISKIAIILFFSVSQVSVQENLKEILSGTGNTKAGIDKADYYLHSMAEDDSIYIFYDQAAKLVYKYDLDKAIEWQTISVDGHRTNTDTSRFLKAFYNLGYFHHKNGNLKEAEKIYKDLVAYNAANTVTGKSFTALGKIKRDDGDYYLSEQYFIEADKILRNARKGALSYYRNLLEYISLLTIINADESDTAIEKLFARVDSLILKRDIQLSDQYDYLTRMSDYYEKKGNFKETYNFRKKALQVALEIDEDSRIGNSYNMLGVVYIKLKNFEAAIETLDKVGELQNDPYYTGASYNNLGDAYLKSGNDQKAIAYYKKSLQTLWSTSAGSRIDTLESLKRNNYKDVLLQAIQSIVQFYEIQYEQNSQKEILQELLRYVELADQLLEIIRMQSFEDNSKLYWREKAHAIYGKGIMAAYELMDYEKFFYLQEKNKAILLLENLTEQQAEDIGGIPEDVIKRGRYLKSRSLEGMSEGLDNFLVYQDFLDSVKVAFPKYSAFKRKLEVIDINTVRQQILGENITDILEFFADEEYTYVLHISKETVAMNRIGRTDQLNEKLIDYIALCKKPIRSNAVLSRYRTLAVELYNTLLSSYKPTGDKLLIVADGLLQNIPFESLVIPGDELKIEKSYLITKCNISYAYSLSHYKQNVEVGRNSEKSFLAIAPERFDDQSENQLRFNVFEARRASELFSGDLFSGDTATKQMYLREMDNYQIIHLSTHASSGLADSSYITFRDEKLWADEIYATRNDAELLFLSACQTSLGKQAAGEGVMSLSRAFFHAGAASVVSTLWNVNDETSVEITVGFYEALAEGASRSEALRKAKINYLNSHNGSEISPYYWSSLILVGDNSGLSLISAGSQRALYIGYILAGILSLLIIGRLFKLRQGNLSRDKSGTHQASGI